MARIYSYVVRYDSGFAPNPFYGYCTLATCKPDIRRAADIGDWVIGSGSADRKVMRGGYLVYAMRVTEIKSFSEYAADGRFDRKRPYRNGSRKQSCGDNIYYPSPTGGGWCQRDSFHSRDDGGLHQEHAAIDTKTDRVLLSNDFVYFGGTGPLIPDDLLDKRAVWICKSGRGRVCFDDEASVNKVVGWIQSLDAWGYQGAPYEWISLRE